MISTTLENGNSNSNGSETKHDSTGDSKLLENFSCKVNLNNEITPYKKEIAGEKRDD